MFSVTLNPLRINKRHPFRSLVMWCDEWGRSLSSGCLPFQPGWSWGEDFQVLQPQFTWTFLWIHHFAAATSAPHETLDTKRLWRLGSFLACKVWICFCVCPHHSECVQLNHLTLTHCYRRLLRLEWLHLSLKEQCWRLITVLFFPMCIHRLRANIIVCVCVSVCVCAMLLLYQQVPVWSCACRTVSDSKCDQNEFKKKDRKRIIERTELQQAQIKKKKQNKEPWLNINLPISCALAHAVLLSLAKCMEGDVWSYRQWLSRHFEQ